MFTLINETTGQRWNYDSEAQLKTATRLYAMQNPKASVSVSINGATHKVR